MIVVRQLVTYNICSYSSYYSSSVPSLLHHTHTNTNMPPAISLSTPRLLHLRLRIRASAAHTRILGVSAHRISISVVPAARDGAANRCVIGLVCQVRLSPSVAGRRIWLKKEGRCLGCRRAAGCW